MTTITSTPSPRLRWCCRSCGARNRMRQRVCHRCRQNRPRH
ncbi:hypothetical protein [Amycolatopsis vastitatis]|nr:hypothetical protein [Amycolatopsis vastitatis]